ncbi:MAG: hypothetical protein ACPGQS_10090, partial [Bradymonadia bacterium]
GDRSCKATRAGSWKKSTSPADTAPKEQVVSASDRKNQKRPRPTKRTPAQLRDLKRRETPSLMQDFERYQSQCGLSEHDADIITGSETLNNLFSHALGQEVETSVLTKWFTNVLPALLEELEADPKTDGHGLTEVIKLIEDKVISSTSGKEVAQELLHHGGTAKAIVDRLNLAQVSDETSITAILSPILAANQNKVEAIAQGRTQLAGFFIGQVMRQMPNANPQVVKQLVHRHFGLSS